MRGDTHGDSTVSPLYDGYLVDLRQVGIIVWSGTGLEGFRSQLHIRASAQLPNDMRCRRPGRTAAEVISSPALTLNPSSTSGTWRKAGLLFPLDCITTDDGVTGLVRIYRK